MPNTHCGRTPEARSHNPKIIIRPSQAPQRTSLSPELFVYVSYNKYSKWRSNFLHPGTPSLLTICYTRTMNRRASIISFFLFLFAILIAAPLFASAHEVYVLSPAEITLAIGTPSFSLLTVAKNNIGQFIFWAFMGILIVFCVFWISTLRFLERWLDPLSQE